MRSLVTGRVVDSYTNVSTVKLFAHADREDSYAKEGMSWMLDAVNRSMRMSTLMTTALQVLSGILIFTMAGTVDLAVVCGFDHHRRHRLLDRPDAAHQGHVAMDHLGSGGPVREYRRRPGRHRDDRARPHHRRCAGRQAAQGDQGRDRLRPGALQLWQGRPRRVPGRSSTNLSLKVAARRKSGPGRPFRRRQIDARQSACCASTIWRAAAS